MTDFLRQSIEAEAVAAAAAATRLEHVRATIQGLQQTERGLASGLDRSVAIDALVSDAGLVARSELTDEVGQRIAEAGLDGSVVRREHAQ